MLPVEMNRSVPMKYAPAIQRTFPSSFDVKRTSWLTVLTSRNWLWFWSRKPIFEEERLRDRQEVPSIACENFLDGVERRDRGQRARVHLVVELERYLRQVAIVLARVVHAYRKARVVDVERHRGREADDVEVQRLRVEFATCRCARRPSACRSAPRSSGRGTRRPRYGSAFS